MELVSENKIPALPSKRQNLYTNRQISCETYESSCLMADVYSELRNYICRFPPSSAEKRLISPKHVEKRDGACTPGFGAPAPPAGPEARGHQLHMRGAELGTPNTKPAKTRNTKPAETHPKQPNNPPSRNLEFTKQSLLH